MHFCSMSKRKYPEIGSSALLEVYPTKKLKVGIVNVDEEAVNSTLSSVLDVPFHAIAIAGVGDSLFFLSKSASRRQISV